MYEELLLSFFVKFSRYEYALKASGKVKPKSNTNDAAEAKWEDVEKALQKLDEARAGQMKASAGLLLIDPPRRQVFRDQQLQWVSAGTSGDWAKDLVSSLKRVRNNLFHGGKYAPVGVSLTLRSAELIHCAQAVLDEFLLLPTLNDVADHFRSYDPNEG